MFPEPNFIISCDIKYCMGESSKDGGDGEQEAFLIENNPGNMSSVFEMLREDRDDGG